MPITTVFHGSSSPRKFHRFEIRLDNDFVVLHGTQHETPDFKVTGNVVLMSTESISLKSIKLTLEGRRKTSHDTKNDRERILSPQLPTQVVNKKTFLLMVKTLTPESSKMHTFGPSNHEFPFEFDLRGSLPESIEGMEDNYIIYSLRAVADRGVMAKDLITKRPLRVVRTLGPDRTELLRTSEVTGEWPNKIKYQLTCASRAVIFGTTVNTEFELTPLLDKLRIGVIKVRIEEIRKAKTIPGPEYELDGELQDMWIDKRTVFRETREIPEDSDETDEQLQLPMKKFKLGFKLPRLLRLCRQSVGTDNEWIQINHMMHYDIELHNPDGHKSELKAHHSIQLFISPNLPIEDHEVWGPSVLTQPTTSDLNGDMHAAPPLYETHQLDSLYDDVSLMSGYATPAHPSNGSTPHFSRQGSDDDLSAMNQGGAEPFPENLRSRLANLQMNQAGNGHAETAERTTNGFYDMEALDRMPSYATAIRTPVRTPFSEAPPSYATATSRSGSVGS